MIEMNQEPSDTVTVRIRFAGSQEAENFHMTSTEFSRFHSDWKSYLGGDGAIGGEYTSQEADRPLLISLNFSLIAYLEPGKVY